MHTTNAAIVRAATSADLGGVTHLLRHARFSHAHADWRLPGEWIDEPGFLLWARPSGRPLACLVGAPDPPPAAWVRLAAVLHRDDAETALPALMESLIVVLQQQAIKVLGWLVADDWVQRRLSGLGFTQTNAVVTYRLDRPMVTAIAPTTAQLRAAESADMPHLVALERTAFDPLWRHSEDGLRRGWQRASSFQVATIDGTPVGFAYCVDAPDGSTHLVRITVDPAWQGRGIGRQLMADTLALHAARGRRFMTLNTQRDNRASQQLYNRLGFRRVGRQYPVWTRPIASEPVT